MNGNKAIRIALTKGRLEKDTVGLFEKMGFDVTELKEKGRRLILNIPGENMEVVLAKAADVITYVELGACDIGVVGKDTILEHGGKYFEVADLGFGRCRFALATKKGLDFYGGVGVKTVATKYPKAPLLKIADGIVDIVETGTTLKENGLAVIEDVVPISARLIVNTVSMKLKKERIEQLTDLMLSQL